MEYKLIATDMDDTLLNSKNKISKGNKQAIINVQKKGVKFVLASGRPTFAMTTYAKKLHMHNLGGYILAFNGGEIRNAQTNEIIYYEGLEKEDMEKMYRASKELGVAVVFYNEDTVYGSLDNKNVRVEPTLCKMKFQKFDDIEEIFSLGIEKSTKAMFIAEPEEIKKADKIMKEKFGNDYFFATSKPIFLEIANKNVNKGKSIVRLGEIIEIKPEEMIAIGDGENDRSLLEKVGMPAVVANAKESLKQIAKFESSSNEEDGLKTLIDKFF